MFKHEATLTDYLIVSAIVGLITVAVLTGYVLFLMVQS